jgi:hypothetical protein
MIPAELRMIAKKSVLYKPEEQTREFCNGYIVAMLDVSQAFELNHKGQHEFEELANLKAWRDAADRV